MNRARTLFFLAGISLPLLLAACHGGATRAADATGTPDRPALCNRDAADALSGKERVSDDQARRLTGATLVRQIAPGSPVTMDFRQERVTIETDPSIGKIVRAYCG